MKNLHSLPTKQPSKLHLYNKLFLSPNYQNSKTINSIVEGRNIVITNDEHFGANDWVLYENPNNLRKLVVKVTTIENGKFDYERQTLDIREIPIKWGKKIILITDPKVIADGIQAIDDDFIEWFIKNPSCEWVEVQESSYQKKLEKPIYIGLGVYIHDETIHFLKIIIPEEPIKPFMDERKEALAWFNAKDDLEKSELCFIYYGSIVGNIYKALTGRQIETIWKGENGEITLQDIDEQVTVTEKRGEKIVQYLNKYEGQSIYNEIALAIEFGYQIKQEEDDEAEKKVF